MTRIEHEHPAGVREEAARWFAREHSGEMDAAERKAFQAWRVSDAAHDREYRALSGLWSEAGRIPSQRLLALAEDGRPRSARARSGSRWKAAGAVAACAAGCVVAYAAYDWQRAQPVFTASMQTVRGETKSVTLPDGSALDLNTQTRLQVRYYRDRRTVAITSGEASFAVDRDPARPFIVEAGAGRVRVTGTRFNVRRDGDVVSVAVASGNVEVSAMTPGAQSVRLSAGLGTRVDAAGHVDRAYSVDMTALSAWREGKLVFDDMPLAEVMREVERYRDRPVRLADPELGRLRLSGTFSVHDTDALLAALPRILPARVRAMPDGSVEIHRP